jgi:protein O-GlcNAc transferase
VFVRLGILHGKLDDLDRAIFYFRKALDVMPESDVANYNLGLLFQKQNDFDKALLAYQKVLAVNPQHIDSYINMGALCQSQGDFDGAISCYRKVIQLKPEHALAYGNLGLALRKQNKLEEATQWFEKSLSLDPNQADCLSNYVYQLKDICDWEKLKVFGERLDAINQKAIDASVRTPETPFINLTRHSDPALNYAVAKSWVDNMGCQMPEKGPQFSFDRHRHSEGPIIIGYLSNNFGNHPVAHLMHNIYGLHDRNNFTIICYSYGKNDGSEYRAIIEKGCDKFVDLFHLSALDSANCINEDQVDILVDLVGHTEDNRMAICAYRPAPVQAAYLGFPGTSGADFIDYIITDRIVTPECDAPNYSEKFVYMPDSYQVNDKLSEVSAYQLKKCDFGLPEKSFIFCSFNRSYKIDPVMFDCWMKILQKVDQSVLWLLSGGKVTERNLKREAKARGIDPERLIFAGIMPLKEHLARHVFADIALDTCIYNGGATTSHALKAGVPLIALQGSHFLSRMSASSLSAAGLPELVASDLEEYESLAVRLAGHPAELKSIKVKLQKNCLAGPIFDTSRFVSNLERAYKRMWQAYLSGEGARQEIFF